MARTSPTHRERHETGVGRLLDDFPHGGASLMGGGDVEEDQLVGPLGIVGTGALDRIAGITDILESCSLDDPPTIDIETGDDSFAEHPKRLKAKG
jgi:hypothetical protein